MDSHRFLDAEKAQYVLWSAERHAYTAIQRKI